MKVSFQGQQSEKNVTALGRFIPISKKTGGEVARFVNGQKVDRAITYLEQVVEGKQAIPFKRRKKDIPHRKGPIAAGRFPKKVSLEFIKLLKQIKANAQDKGLNEDNLVVIHAAAQKASKVWRYGRKRGRTRKLAHLEMIATEIKEKKKTEEKPKK